MGPPMHGPKKNPAAVRASPKISLWRCPARNSPSVFRRQVVSDFGFLLAISRRGGYGVSPGDGILGVPQCVCANASERRRRSHGKTVTVFPSFPHLSSSFLIFPHLSSSFLIFPHLFFFAFRELSSMSCLPSIDDPSCCGQVGAPPFK